MPATKTVALLVDHEEVKNQSLECLEHVHGSEHFRHDLTLKKSAWVYTNDAQMRRCLLIQQKLPKSTDSDAETKQHESMRELAAHSVGQLQARKVSDVEVLASSKIDPVLLATFHQSFHLSNYEWSQKGNVEDEDEKKDDEEEVDERTKRKTKTLDSFSIEHETDLAKEESFKFCSASAEATIFARDLANTRGSEATPCWMEA